MSKFPIKSISEQISEQIFTLKTLQEAQTLIIEFVNTKNINEKDKMNILNETKNAKSLVGLQRYTANMLLKYEGMSTERFNRTARQEAAETLYE